MDTNGHLIHLCMAAMSLPTTNSKNRSTSDWSLAWGLHNTCCHLSGAHRAEDKFSPYLFGKNMKSSPHANLLWWEHGFRRRRIDVSFSQRDATTTGWVAAALHIAKNLKVMEAKRENKSRAQTVFTLQHARVKLFLPIILHLLWTIAFFFSFFLVKHVRKNNFSLAHWSKSKSRNALNFISLF